NSDAPALLERLTTPIQPSLNAMRGMTIELRSVTWWVLTLPTKRGCLKGSLMRSGSPDSILVPAIPLPGLIVALRGMCESVPACATRRKLSEAPLLRKTEAPVALNHSTHWL